MRNLFKKKPKPIKKKKYIFKVSVTFKNGTEERWTTDHPVYTSIFHWPLYRNLWKWFYCRKSEVYSVQAGKGTKDSISIISFNRSDILKINGSIAPFEQVVK